CGWRFTAYSNSVAVEVAILERHETVRHPLRTSHQLRLLRDCGSHVEDLGSGGPKVNRPAKLGIGPALRRARAVGLVVGALEHDLRAVPSQHRERIRRAPPGGAAG